MKNLVLAISLMVSGVSLQSLASSICDESLQSAVQAQAAKDFPGQNISSDRPDTSGVDAGSAVHLQVSVRIGNLVVGTYDAQVSSACGMSLAVRCAQTNGADLCSSSVPCCSDVCTADASGIGICD